MATATATATMPPNQIFSAQLDEVRRGLHEKLKSCLREESVSSITECNINSSALWSKNKV